MLPSLRLLAIATLSTFLVTIGAALFVSSRLLPEPVSFHTDRNQDDGAMGRISGGWPDTRQLGPHDVSNAAKAVPALPPAPVPTAKIVDRPTMDNAPQPAASGTQAATAPADDKPADTGVRSGVTTKAETGTAPVATENAPPPKAPDASPATSVAQVPGNESVAVKRDSAASEAPPSPAATAVKDASKDKETPAATAATKGTADTAEENGKTAPAEVAKTPEAPAAVAKEKEAEPTSVTGAASDRTGSIGTDTTPAKTATDDAAKVASRPDKETVSAPATTAPAKPKQVEKPKPARRIVRRRHPLPAAQPNAATATNNSAPARDFFVDFPSGGTR